MLNSERIASMACPAASSLHCKVVKAAEHAYFRKEVLSVPHMVIVSVVFLLLWAIVTTCAAVYCGWRVLDRRAEKTPIATTLPDQVLGLSAMLLGIFVFSWLPYSVGEIAHQWLLGHSVFHPATEDMICSIIPTAVAAGLIGCGARVCAVVRWVPWICRDWENVFDGDTWQQFFGGCSLLTGVVGICFAFVVVVAEAAPLFR
jgi:hypothetical protein